MAFVIGEMVGPYLIQEQLGQGGMATVFKAYHEVLDRHVALKVLHPAFHEDPNFQARFQREARVVARLEHPNIVPIFDFAEFDRQPYLVMKFIEGETLKAHLKRASLSQDELIKVVNAVGLGLSYAHAKGILHRDIKPSNVLLAPDGRIYLADFGLARIAQAGESTLSSEVMLGTPQYISPEQAKGERDLDEGTDIYSFGVLLYELTVGRVPYTADTPFSIIHDQIYTPLPKPREVNPSVPKSVEMVLVKALAKGREDRFSSIDEMVKAFREAVLFDTFPSISTLQSPPRQREDMQDTTQSKTASEDSPDQTVEDTREESADVPKTTQPTESRQVAMDASGPIKADRSGTMLYREAVPDFDLVDEGRRSSPVWMVVGLIVGCLLLTAFTLTVIQVLRIVNAV